MFTKFKKLINKSLSDIENFHDNNRKIQEEIKNKNKQFSNNLNEKILNSNNNISNIRKSIQNTKL